MILGINDDLNASFIDKDYKYDPENLNFPQDDSNEDYYKKNVDMKNLIASFKTLNQFFNFVYEYHQSNGYGPFILKCIKTMIYITFVIGLIFFITLCIDWKQFLNPNDDQLAKDAFGFLIVSHPISILINIIYQIYGFIVYYSQLLKIYKITKMKRYYQQILGLNSKQIQQLKWDSIKQIILEKHDFDFKSNNICEIIHRNDNLMSHIFREDIFGIKKYKNIYHSQLLTWLISKLFVEQILGDDDVVINTSFFNNPQVIKSKLKYISFVLFLLTPCFILYHIFISGLKEIQHFNHNHVNKTDRDTNNKNNTKNNNNLKISSSTNYKWSNYAKLILRNYNEYQHEMNDRLNDSANYIEQVIECFPNYILTEIVSMFISPLKIIIGMILFITLPNASLLITVVICGYPLISILTFLTPIAYYCHQYIMDGRASINLRTMKKTKKIYLINKLHKYNIVVNPKPKEPKDDPNAKFLYGINDDDIGNIENPRDGKDYEYEEHMNQFLFAIKEDATTLYQHKFFLFCNEFCGIILLPYLFGYIFPNNIITILSMLEEYTTTTTYTNPVGKKIKNSPQNQQNIENRDNINGVGKMGKMANININSHEYLKPIVPMGSFNNDNENDNDDTIDYHSIP